VSRLKRYNGSWRRPALNATMAEPVVLGGMSLALEERFKDAKKTGQADCGWQEGLNLMQGLRTICAFLLHSCIEIDNTLRWSPLIRGERDGLNSSDFRSGK
jgi:hypothetical protein